MRRNLIVLGGVAVLMVTGYFFPVLSFPAKTWHAETIRLTSAASMVIGFIILWFMQTTSKWRGVLWIVLSVLGPMWTINEVQRQYEFFVSRGIKVYPDYVSGQPSYEIGLYLTILGYTIVLIGSVWDLVQKRREEKFSVISGRSAHKDIPSN